MTRAMFTRGRTGGRALLVGALLLGVGTACEKDSTGPAAQATHGRLTSSVAATEDVTKPTLTAFDFSPKEVNTSQGSATVTVHFTVTDDLSGAQWVLVSFRSPSGQQHQSGSTAFTPAVSHTGSLSVTFPQFGEAGTWTVFVRLQDAVGNLREYFPTEPVPTGVVALEPLGFPTELTVVSVQDVTAPTLTAFDFAPRDINTSQGPATVTVNLTVTDDLSGARSILVSFRSPSGQQFRSGSSGFTPTTSHTGSLTVTFPQLSEAGTWTAFVRVEDAVSNLREYFPFADPRVEDLSALGFPTELTVVSVQDVTAPFLTAFDFSPREINTGEGPATVTVNFTVTDDFSGAQWVLVSFRSPSGQQHQSGSTAFTAAASHTGSLTVAFPQFSEAGIWTAFARVQDAVGNLREYFPFADPRVEDLSALGFPTELLVIMNRPPKANAGRDQVLECAGPHGALVSLDGSASSDPDGDALEHEWFAGGTRIATGATPSVSFGLGAHLVTLRVTDDQGATDEDEVSVTVRDTHAPTIRLAVDPVELWPPNHAMRLVARGIWATDDCDPAPTLAVEVTSNEPINGLGDGDTAPDWQVVANGDGTFDVLVRAERSGTGSDRVYTITATATDASGNRSSTSGRITVPHSRGSGSR